jgi:hypothetical protein
VLKVSLSTANASKIALTRFLHRKDPPRGQAFLLFRRSVSMPDWRKLYRATVLETSATNIGRRIAETQVALFLRHLEPGTNLEFVDECHEIQRASKALVLLKWERASAGILATIGSEG